MMGNRPTAFRIAAAAVLALAFAAASGCGKRGGEAPAPATGEAGATTPAPPAMMPPAHQESGSGGAMTGPAGELPAGHPPLDGSAMMAPQLAPPAPGTGIGTTGLSWSAPAEWESQVPSSGLRRAQYRVPGPGGDGECVVFYFGPGEGGDPRSNALRWASQFRPAGGKDPEQALKTAEMTVSGLRVMTVEMAGTYLGGGPMMGGPSEPKPDYMLLGAVAEGPDANWFFKFTGPAKTVEAQRAAFGEMLQSLRTGA